MFKDTHAFSGFAVNDVRKAKAFYGETLGLERIEPAVARLKEAGVRFERYDQAELKTGDDGIFRRRGPLIAWFKDPAGNVLSVLEQK